ncbi:SDR family NAD(P)-dependent oxidoreductase [Sphingopyxis granuli]|uniref:SDR family NAD(P)-dependent oxidoreductase n=1 Tax=Sphingopyxis granuli TaxID=267128 RepID=UPI003B026102
MNNPNFRRLANKVVIVTGAGTGIGEAAARAFAREGASIMLVGPARTAPGRHCEGGSGGRRRGDGRCG